MDKREFLELLDKYLDGKASYEEEQLLIAVYQTFQEKHEGEVKIEDADRVEEELIGRFKRLTEKPRRVSFYRLGWLKAAAVLLVVLSLVAVYRARRSSSPGDYYTAVAHKNAGGFTEYYNNTTAEKKIVLPDGSYVILAKGSKIGFVDQFPATKREVFLEGEGFFDVAKETGRPFFVYTDKLVAQVLGTSFTIKSDKGKASVAVKTGRVSVFKREDISARRNLSSGIILTPNQVADLNDKQELERKVAKDPAVIKEIEKTAFYFDATPVTTVFKRLQAAYGIKVNFDEKILSSCTISAKMGEENFYQKLSLICHAINATYEVQDGAIVITASGCTN